MLVALLAIAVSSVPVETATKDAHRLDTLLDAKFSDSAGNEFQLSKFLGKPTLVFYEDRHCREQNRKVKDELWKRGKESGLADAAHVIGVANLEAFDFWPARNFARSAVADIEKKVGIKVLIDWKGALTSTPWNLPEKKSTVMLLDADGVVRYSYSGAMTEKDMDELFTLLAGLVHKP